MLDIHVWGWGVHHSLFPWGPGNSLAFICIKSECPGHAWGVGGGVFGGFKWQVHNSLCLNLLFNFVYWNYFVSMFWCLFWKEDSPKKFTLFFICVFVKSLNFWDLWQLITSILHCYQQSKLIKVTNLFLHWFSLIAKIIWNHSLILFALDCCFVTFKIALLKICLL